MTSVDEKFVCRSVSFAVRLSDIVFVQVPVLRNHQRCSRLIWYLEGTVGDWVGTHPRITGTIPSFKVYETERM